MAARSAGGRSESEANADTSEGMCRLGIEVLELRDVLLVLPRLQANLAYKLHGREGETTVDEYQGARVGRVDHHCPHVRRAGSVIEPDVGVGRLVVVDPDSRREVHDGELPPRNRAVAVARQVHGDRKSTRLNSSHTVISYAVFCLKKKKRIQKKSNRK